MNRQAAGMLGEWRAALYLLRRGMRILKWRYRAGHHEIDLIAQDGNTLVFVEVKARPSGSIQAGARAVGPDKQAHLRQAAQVYLAAHPAGSVRFDVMEISAAGVRHIKNAF